MSQIETENFSLTFNINKMDPVTNYCEAILGPNTDAKESIRLIPQLTNCSDKLLNLIFSYSKPVRLEAKEVLISEGLFDQWVYFIVDGDLDVIINDNKLGNIKGPIVGERCILGEPRGATLVAGKKGIMALGIEMSLMDEINREINNFSQITESESEIQAFSDEKNELVLEFLLLVLSDVVSRILELKRNSISILQSLTTSTENIPEHDLEDEAKRLYKIQKSDFSSLLDKVYQSAKTDETFNTYFKKASSALLKEIFILKEDYKVSLVVSFQKLHEKLGFPFAALVDLTLVAFEVLSKYTASVNQSTNQILSLFENEEEKKKAIYFSHKFNDVSDISNEIVEELKRRLFDPAQQALASKQQNSGKEKTSKLNQADIDALF